jgi:1,4-alpha-glucan branching enzyme
VKVIQGYFLTDYDLHLLIEGSHYRAWEKLGAHPAEVGGERGTWFAVWAPNARDVSVVGDFNGWEAGAHPLGSRGDSGIWEGFIPGVDKGALYKYAIASDVNGHREDKADPYAFACEIRPQSSSMVWDLSGYEWGDQDWLAQRGRHHAVDAPVAIYEVHLGSWMRNPEEGNRWLTYRELAPKLAEYVREMGFTHVELLPVSEHPLDASWGYQAIGYFAPTSRFGTPQDFMYFVDVLHQNGIGVILDWVPAHFPRDGHGLGFFDGTHLYEHADPRKGEHRDWGTFIFNYGRREVSNFLLTNALFWLEVYHIDGLRVDAVASMLYLDYSREEGEWIPNEYGGRENLEAVAFLKRFNELVYERYPDVITVAEESTACFSLLYAFHENFILPFSHDEVVHGKGSMIGKMPGDDWQKFANLRLLYGYMYLHPGKKLLFMGGEFGQWAEWNHDASLEWQLIQYDPHQGLQRWVRDLNTFLRGERALFEQDFEPAGFAWIDCHDSQQSVLSFLRQGRDPGDVVVCACNFTPVPRHNYRLGVPLGGWWKEALNSDAPLYGGSGQGNMEGVPASPVASHGHYHSLNITLPPLGIVVFHPADEG